MILDKSKISKKNIKVLYISISSMALLGKGEFTGGAFSPYSVVTKMTLDKKVQIVYLKDGLAA